MLRIFAVAAITTVIVALWIGPAAIHGIAEHTLDVWRTALPIGTIFEEPHIRIVIVDGRVAPPIQHALAQRCREGWVTPAACAAAKLCPSKSRTRGTGSITGITTISMSAGIPAICNHCIN